MDNTTLPHEIYIFGDSDDNIKIVQQALSLMGYNITADGYYGMQTKGIIQSIQKKYPESLIADGVYRPLTRNQIISLLSSDYRIVKNPDDILVLVNKHNSLPHDYIPADLVVPAVPFPFEEFHPKKLMRKEASSALEQLFAAASDDNINLSAESGYRSFERQAEIFAENVNTSAEANQSSARPGESEHQTGLAIDISSPAIWNNLTQAFGEMKEGQWLSQNAPLFGFIIRYPEGKEDITGYQYEPWHIRYVGGMHAKLMTQKNLTLEEYLVSG